MRSEDIILPVCSRRYMRNASRRPTGDDTVRKTNAHAVPLAALTITRASTITDKNRCCWTHCQTITT